MEPESLLPSSQEPVNCPYPEPDQSNALPHIIFLWKYILRLSSLLHVRLPTDLFPSHPHTPYSLLGLVSSAKHEAPNKAAMYPKISFVTILNTMFLTAGVPTHRQCTARSSNCCPCNWLVVLWPTVCCLPQMPHELIYKNLSVFTTLSQFSPV